MVTRIIFDGRVQQVLCQQTAGWEEANEAVQWGESRGEKRIPPLLCNLLTQFIEEPRA